MSLLVVSCSVLLSNTDTYMHMYGYDRDILWLAELHIL
jgi:hypothetical protein